MLQIMNDSITSPQVKDNANKALDITRRLFNFGYILLGDDERLHVSDNFSRAHSPTPALCDSVPHTSRTRFFMEVPSYNIEILPARQLEELLVYPLSLRVCKLCEFVAKKMIKQPEDKT